MKRDWALAVAATCPDLGGEALAVELERHRGTNRRTDDLEDVVRATRDFVDATLAEAALDIAVDPAAGEVARVQALRVLAYQFEPGSSASFEQLVDSGRDIFFRHTEPVTFGTRLASDFAARAFDHLVALIGDRAQPRRVRNAARDVANQVLFGDLCAPPASGSPPCDRKWEQLVEAEKSLSSG